MKKLDTPIAMPSIAEIEKYHNGTLDFTRRQAIDQLASKNEMVKDALEGYALTPAYASVPTVGLLFKSKATPWWHLAGWGMGLAAGVLLAIAVVPNGESEMAHKASERFAELKKDIPKENVIDSTPVADSLPQELKEEKAVVFRVKSSIDKSDSLQTGLDGYADLGNDIKETYVTRNWKSVDPVEVLPLDTASSYIIIKDYWMNDLTRSSSASRGDLEKVKGIPDDILHVLNYHIVDYTATRKTEWTSISIDDLGVPASFENEAEKSQSKTEASIRKVPYLDYIEECIKALSDGRYTVAINGFSTVLKQYPDDINALFYGAMSYYYNGQYEKAINQFVKVEENAFDTFDEERAFYIAKSLKALKRYDDANSLFDQIVKANGFYAEQASKEIVGRK